MKRFKVLGGKLPDYQCNFETYTNENIMEMEVLSPVTTLLPGETISQEERFSIYSGVKLSKTTDEEIDKMFEDIGFNG